MGELLDTAPLRDQRTMVGVLSSAGAHRTVDEVKQGWKDWADTHGLPVRRRAGDTTVDLRESKHHLAAYVSAGKWIADCPRCNGGVACWPGHDKGCCLDCGTVFRIDYPDDDDIRTAVELLRVRPELQRNWRPELEDVDYLARENAVYKFAEPADTVVRLAVADLRDVLSARAFRELEDKGLIPKTSGGG